MRNVTTPIPRNMPSSANPTIKVPSSSSTTKREAPIGQPCVVRAEHDRHEHDDRDHDHPPADRPVVHEHRSPPAEERHDRVDEQQGHEHRQRDGTPDLVDGRRRRVLHVDAAGQHVRDALHDREEHDRDDDEAHDREVTSRRRCAAVAVRRCRSRPHPFPPFGRVAPHSTTAVGYANANARRWTAVRRA